MNHPPFLKKGDKIGIIAPARSITFEEVYPSIQLFTRWGLEPVLGIHVFNSHNQFAGTDHQRQTDLQQMLDDDSIRAIVAARGGYGTVRIIDGINFARFIKKPKWIAGYSDITVLHSHIHRHFGIQTLHATMPYSIKSLESLDISAESLRKALFGEEIFYQERITFKGVTGLSEGILVGGNLSILCSLAGTPSDLNTDGKILFLEDVDEYLYHIDRMIMNLKRSGKLKNLKGLIVGGMSEMKDNAVPFGKTAFEIILEAVKEYGYPVCFGFPAGHEKENVALYLGRKIKFLVDEDEINIIYI
jgi:muramoyltetrapeptide carboxypeptidase